MVQRRTHIARRLCRFATQGRHIRTARCPSTLPDGSASSRRGATEHQAEEVALQAYIGMTWITRTCTGSKPRTHSRTPSTRRRAGHRFKILSHSRRHGRRSFSRNTASRRRSITCRGTRSRRRCSSSIDRRRRIYSDLLDIGRSNAIHGQHGLCPRRRRMMMDHRQGSRRLHRLGTAVHRRGARIGQGRGTVMATTPGILRPSPDHRFWAATEQTTVTATVPRTLRRLHRINLRCLHWTGTLSGN